MLRFHKCCDWLTDTHALMLEMLPHLKMMKDDDFKLLKGFADKLTDKWTNKQTFVIVESLSLKQDRKSTDCDTLTPWRIICNLFFLSHLKLNLLSLTACWAVHGAYHFHILMPFYTILILCHFHTQAPFLYPNTISQCTFRAT